MLAFGDVGGGEGGGRGVDVEMCPPNARITHQKDMKRKEKGRNEKNGKKNINGNNNNSNDNDNVDKEERGRRSCVSRWL